MSSVIGIDLAGSEKRNTGICVLDVKSLRIIDVKIVHSDAEIIADVELHNPLVIAIDAPLSLPKGRKSIDERNNHHFRKCDRELLKFGIKFFPITLGPMRKLTKRGMELKRKFEGMGFKVIEVYPGAAQDLLNIPRKRDLIGLRKGLERLGIKGIREDCCADELDAITAAYVGLLYLKGKYIAIGEKDEGVIILPKV